MEVSPPGRQGATTDASQNILPVYTDLLTPITTLYNVCAVPWGCSVPWGVQYRGDIMSTVGGYLEYRGGCSVPWGDIMINVGDILSTVGDIMSTVGVILSTMGDVQYLGGIS